jgi:protocatechuate 3,4-dioxygenase beta subunit
LKTHEREKKMDSSGCVCNGGSWLFWGSDKSTKPMTNTVAIDPWAGKSAANNAGAIDKLRAARSNAPLDVRAGSVSGRVTAQATGAGIASAMISISKDDTSDESDHDTIEVQTDADGRFKSPALAPGNYSVGAAADAFAAGSLTHIVVAPAEAKTGVDIALAAGGITLQGTVTDIGGGPIAETIITVYDQRPQNFDATASYAAKTDANGKYRISLNAGSWTARAKHPNYAAARKNVELSNTTVTADFQLVPGGMIRGVVVSAIDGAPVAVAKVNVTSGAGRRKFTATTIANDVGAFEFRGLPSGTIALSASARGFTSAQPLQISLSIAEERNDVTLALERGFTISGFVVQKTAHSTGVAGIGVTAMSFSQPSGGQNATSANDGYFELVGIKPGTYMVAAIGKKFVPEINQGVSVVDKDVSNVVIEMATGVTLSGKVSPTMQAKLSLAPKSLGIGNLLDIVKVAASNASTTADGSFVMNNVPAGEWVLTADGKNGAAGKLDVNVSDKDQSGLTVPMTEQASVSGVVVDSDGKPVAAVTVALSATKTGNVQIRDGRFDNDVMTATDGTFVKNGLQQGTYRIAVSDERGMIPYAERKGSFQIEILDAKPMTNVKLVVEPRDGVIRGVVVTANNQPVADAWVTLSPAKAAAKTDDDQKEQEQDFVAELGSDATPVLTDDQGRFAITGLVRRGYNVVADSANGSARASQKGVNPGQTVTLKLVAMASLSGVVQIEGKPVPSYQISCRPKEGPDQERFADGVVFDENSMNVTSAAGKYQIARLNPGRYECEIVAPTASLREIVDVKGVMTKNFQLAPLGSIVGTLVDEKTGAPIVGAYVIATDFRINGGVDDLMSGNAPRTDAVGHFEVLKAQAGSGNIYFIEDFSGDSTSACMRRKQRRSRLASV